MNDWTKYTITGVLVTALCFAVAFLSDLYWNLTGVQLTAILTVISFVSRYFLLKKTGFNK